MRNANFETIYITIDLAPSALLLKKMLFIHFVTFPKIVLLFIQMKKENKETSRNNLTKYQQQQQNGFTKRLQNE